MLDGDISKVSVSVHVFALIITKITKSYSLRKVGYQCS